MFNVHQSYKPPSYWWVLLWCGELPRQFSCLKKFRALVVPVGGCHKGIILQGRQLPSGLPVICQSCLRRKGNLTGVSAHAPRHRYDTYLQTLRRSIYETRIPEHPHLPILRCKQRPQGPPSFAAPLQLS